MLLRGCKPLAYFLVHSHTMGKYCKEGPFVFHLLAFTPWKDSLMINVFKNPLQLVHWVVFSWKGGKKQHKQFYISNAFRAETFCCGRI